VGQDGAKSSNRRSRHGDAPPAQQERDSRRLTDPRVTKDTHAADILDYGPKANRALRANLLNMNRPASKPSLATPRRFLLLPEESVDGPSRGPRIRRYQLASVGRRREANGVDIATTLIAREFSRLRRM